MTAAIRTQTAVIRGKSSAGVAREVATGNHDTRGAATRRPSASRRAPLCQSPCSVAAPWRCLFSAVPSHAHYRVAPVRRPAARCGRCGVPTSAICSAPRLGASPPPPPPPPPGGRRRRCRTGACRNGCRSMAPWRRAAQPGPCPPPLMPARRSMAGRPCTTGPRAPNQGCLHLHCGTCPQGPPMRQRRSAWKKTNLQTRPRATARSAPRTRAAARCAGCGGNGRPSS